MVNWEGISNRILEVLILGLFFYFIYYTVKNPHWKNKIRSFFKGGQDTL